VAPDTGEFLNINNFTGNGKLSLIGETTDDEIGIAITGQDNVSSSGTFGTYLDASAEAWTVDEHVGKYIEITSGTGN